MRAKPFTLPDHVGKSPDLARAQGFADKFLRQELLFQAPPLLCQEIRKEGPLVQSEPVG